MPLRLSLLSLSVLLLVGCGGMGSDSQDPAPSDPAGPITKPVDDFTKAPAQLYVDGAFADWQDLPVRAADADDGDDGGVGLEWLRVAHSSRRLFLRLTTQEPLNLEERNDLTLYLDTDNDPTTGEVAAEGSGAEFSWTFGGRSGRFRGGTVGHADVGLASLPTVRADTFELSFDRSAFEDALAPGDSLRLVLSSNGDRLPDEGSLGYVLSDTETTVDAPSLDRPAASDLRLLSYNVPTNDFERSSLFETDAQPSYRRILQAVGPDVIGFQEMYGNSADEIEDVVEQDIDGVPEAWNWAKLGNDLVLGSQYAITDSATVPGADGFPSGAFLLDTKDALGDSLVVVLMHPKCCSGSAENQSRQATVDGVVAFLRDVQNGEGPFDVGVNTPIVVAGDMNFVGDPQQPRTLRTGEIQNTEESGDAAAPDWDGTPLLDTNPRHTGAPLHTTTYAPSSYPPGRLDYIYLTDSVLEAVHAFTLNTRALSDAELNENGLQRNDTTIGSDHLPLVVDLTLR
jgi:endonuclease/exonuclease/phosphatase family metal-dependent hydrolase